jgi:5-methylcytosine-specific restriction endonuclease McrA
VSIKVRLRRTCEQLCREIVFLRDDHRCLRCNATKDLQWSHIIRRSRAAAMICEPINSKVLCRGCHHWWTHNEGDGMLWFAQQWPEWARAVHEMRSRYKHERPTMTLAWYRQLLDRLATMAERAS